MMDDLTDKPGQESITPSSDTPATNVRWIVLGIVAFASASAYLTRYCISAANTTIQQDLGLDDLQMGQLMSAFALGYFLFQVPGGWFGNRVGTRLAFALISICWSISNIWSGAASLFYWLWGSRFSLGVFQAGMVPISAKILRDWIPLSFRGVSSALIASCMSIGGAFTMWYTGLLLEKDLSWRFIFYVYSSVGIVWAIGFYVYFRTYPNEHTGVNNAELNLIEAQPVTTEREQGDQPAETVTENSETITSPVDLTLNMLLSTSMWGICVQSFFRAAGYAFFVTWFFAFLEYVYEIDKAEAGMLNSLPLIAVVLGSLTGGVIVDWVLKLTGSLWFSRCGTAVISLTVCGLFTWASVWTSSARELSILIAVGAFFSGIGGPAAWTATIDVGGKLTAVVVGIMNMAGALASVILPIVLGEWFQQLREEGGDWNKVIYLHAVFYFLAAASWLIVTPNITIDNSGE